MLIHSQVIGAWTQSRPRGRVHSARKVRGGDDLKGSLRGRWNLGREAEGREGPTGENFPPQEVNKYFKPFISILDSSTADDGYGDSEEDLDKDIVIKEEVEFNPHSYESDNDSWRRRRAALLAAGE